MYKYHGPNWTYHNYLPTEDIGKEYNVEIQTDAEQVIVNETEPTTYFVVFRSGSWIPYMGALGENLNMNSFLHKLFQQVEQVVAEFTDEHEYEGVSMPKGRRFPLKNVAFYDVNGMPALSVTIGKL